MAGTSIQPDEPITAFGRIARRLSAAHDRLPRIVRRILLPATFASAWLYAAVRTCYGDYRNGLPDLEAVAAAGDKPADRSLFGVLRGTRRFFFRTLRRTRNLIVNILFNRKTFAVATVGFQLALLPVYLGTLLVYCRLAGHKRHLRRLRGEKPRLVWGPYPNFSATEIGRAMRDAGYQCDSIVYYNFDRIWNPSAFAYVLTDDLAKFPSIVGRFLRAVYYHYKVFLRVVRDYDIVHGYFFGGFLRETIFERFEAQLLHLAGCKQINTTVGGDVAVMTDIESHVIRQGMNDMYPYLTTNAAQDAIRKWLRYWSDHSDFIICQCSYMIDALPRWDCLTTQYFPIDTDYWQGGAATEADGRIAPVRIGHSPNHRPLKGTNFLIRAVNQLRAEGLKIELVLLENHRNATVRDILRDCDIVVADLVLQGYAVMAVEGCSLGKPVVQDISDDHLNRVFKLYTGLDEAPFVSTPLEQIKETLRTLVTQPTLRREIGEKSRAYALKYHGYAANARFWQWVYDFVWHKRRAREAFYHPDQKLETLASLNQINLTMDEHRLKSQYEQSLAASRGESGLERLGFFVGGSETASLVENLVRARVIRSNDCLVTLTPDAEEIASSKRPQAIIGLDDLRTYGIETVVMLQDDAAARRRLVQLGISVVNGLNCCSGIPALRAA